MPEINGFHNFKFEPIDNSGHFNVYMDGKQLRGIRHANIDIGVDCIPLVKLEIMANALEIDVTDAKTKTLEDL